MTKCKNNNNIFLDNCKNLLATKRKNTFLKHQKIHSYIDVLSGMIKFHYSALKVIKEIVVNDYINYHIYTNDGSKTIFEINKIPGIKITFNLLKCNSHIVFEFTSRYLRKVTTSDDILKDVQLFFKMVGYEVTTDELRNDLITYSCESTIDLIGVSYLRACEALLYKINDDIVMRRTSDTSTPRAKINSSTPTKYKKISLKLEPFYFEDRMFSDGSSFIIYNKLNDMIANYNYASHWWCHYAHILQLDEQELKSLFLYLNKLDKNKLEEVYRLLANNLHSIMRIEYKINRKYIRQLLKVTRKKPLDLKFNYMINAYDFKEELFIYFTSIYNISVNNKKSSKYTIHPLFSEIQGALTAHKEINGKNSAPRQHLFTSLDVIDKDRKIETQKKCAYTKLRNLEAQGVDIQELLRDFIRASEKIPL
jgi:hypothetical protein